MTPNEIRELRTLRGWTVKDLADAVLADVLTVLRWEGGVSKPQRKRARRMRSLLDKARKAARA